LISQTTIQQILNRVDIAEIIGGFVKLKKRGANYLGLCPFHHEKTPSFTVSPSREIYKCFGCGRSGNTIGFLMEHEKYSYVESLRWLAAKYGVEVEETGGSPELKLQQQAAESLHILNQFAQKYFSDNLFHDEEGQDIALSYLQERGLREEIIQKFQLGYCLDQKDGFSKAAISAQYSPEILQKSGLVVNREDRTMDNYRGRIIFPVHNPSGKILGFGARIIRKNDRAPKYINTPENEIYSKSRILYGSYFARQAIDKSDECLLVEGYTDVISLHQAGIENVVASGGTSLTTEQLRLVKKYTENLTIIYDGDAAGIKAALRGLDLALDEGLQVRLVLIPDNEDPDSYVRKLGPKSFREFIQENKKDFLLFQLEVSLQDAGQDAGKKAQVVGQIAETISRINKPEEFTRRQDYTRRCAGILGIPEEGLLALINKISKDRAFKAERRSVQEIQPDEPDTERAEDSRELLDRDEKYERAIVRTLLEFGLFSWDASRRVADYLLGEFVDQDMIDNPQLLKILETYRKWYEEGLEPTARNFLYQENQEMGNLVVSLLEFHYELSPNWKDHFEGKIFSREELYREDILSTLSYLKLRKIKRLIEINQRDLEKSRLPEEQSMLIETHRHLKNLEREISGLVGTVILK
jgi:DNA primase